MELKQQVECLGDTLTKMPAKSAIGSYLSWLENQIEENKACELFKEIYEPIIKETELEKEKKENLPFLTIVTRTQGKRPEMLRETLLSLVGQEDGDFELILIGHKLDSKQKENVEQIISEQPEMLRRKIRFIELDHGNRTTPLNVGFAHANGRYVAVLDDDDIVMDHWVSSFHQAAEENNGKILHAYVFEQKWETVCTTGGREALRAVDAPKATHCMNFDPLRQTRENNCPLIGLAFPVYYFHKMGFIFDETLTTTEDWEYLMRLAPIAGVADIEEATSIYRLWTNAENSATLHNQDEWQKNYLQIQNKIMDAPVFVPAGNRKSVSQETLQLISDLWPYRTPRICGCTLYLNHGDGFNPNDTATAIAQFNGRDFDVRFDLTDDKASNLKEIRFDVSEEGMFVLQNCFALAEYQDGSAGSFTIDQCRTNGAKSGNKICFLKGDPWMVWSVPQDKILSSVRFVGETHVNMTDEMVYAACRNIGSAEFQLFYSTNKMQFSEAQSVKMDVPLGRFSITFPIACDQPLTALRLDPGEAAGCVINELSISLNNSGEMLCKKPDTNGLQTGSMFTFNQADPQIIWKVSGQKISSVTISGVFAYDYERR